MVGRRSRLTADDIMFWYDDVSTNDKPDPVQESDLRGERLRPVVVTKIDDEPSSSNSDRPTGCSCRTRLWLTAICPVDLSQALPQPVHAQV